MNRSFAWVMFSLYIVAVLYITMFAWNYGASLGPDGPGGRHYNLIPFRSIYRIGVFSPDVIDPIKILIGNVLLFVPFGFFVPYLLKKLRSLWKVIVISVLFSLSIELYQFSFTFRVADVDDLILNTAGAIIGYGCYRIFTFTQKRIHVFRV